MKKTSQTELQDGVRRDLAPMQTVAEIFIGCSRIIDGKPSCPTCSILGKQKEQIMSEN